MRLGVLVPSRGRPESIDRLLTAMEATCRGDTRLIVGLDSDDDRLAEYLEVCKNRCTMVVAPGYKGRLVAYLNRLSHMHLGCYAYGHFGDDNVPRTEGWDLRVVESLKAQGKVSFCFGDDLDPGRPPGSLSIHIFMTTEVVRRLGYMGPPVIQHMYVDPVWFAWGQRTSIEFLSDVVLEHLHYSLGKSRRDESYDASTGLIPADCTRYNAYCDDERHGMNADIKRLGGRPFTSEEMAEFNHALNIPRSWS